MNTTYLLIAIGAGFILVILFAIYRMLTNSTRSATSLRPDRAAQRSRAIQTTFLVILSILALAGLIFAFSYFF